MKKILCFFTVIILVFSLGLCLPASAENDPVITVSQVTAVPGDTIVVSVDISNNPGIQAMTFTLSYDNSIVTYQKYEKGKLSDYTVVNHSSTGYVSFVNCENDNKKYNNHDHSKAGIVRRNDHNDLADNHDDNADGDDRNDNHHNQETDHVHNGINHNHNDLDHAHNRHDGACCRFAPLLQHFGRRGNHHRCARNGGRSCYSEQD